MWRGSPEAGGILAAGDTARRAEGTGAAGAAASVSRML